MKLRSAHALSCYRKVQRTEKSARKRAREFQDDFRWTGKRLRAYECTQCGYWHVGGKTK